MPLCELSYAPAAFRLLNGVFCVVKESGVTSKDLLRNVAVSLAQDLNQFEQRPIRERVVIEGNPLIDPELRVVKKISYADHPLVVGPRYQPQDFLLHNANRIGLMTSGLTVLGIGDYGRDLAQVLAESNFVKTYEVKCKFGRATSNYFVSGRTREKTTFQRQSYARFRDLISRTVVAHRPIVYKAIGIDMQTQDGYELAASGIVRPISEKTVPLLFNIKCTFFDPPDFTIVIQTANEEEEFIGTLVHGLGLRSKSTAAIVTLNCIRYGYFTLDNALLPKYWTAERVINNITAYQHLTTEEKISPTAPALQKMNVAEAGLSEQKLIGPARTEEHRLSLTDRPVPLARSALDE